MPLKLNVGLSRKIGLPNYSSLGASCHVELELDSALLQTDREAFQWQVRNAYGACQQAVQEELSRHESTPGDSGRVESGQIGSPFAGRAPGPYANRPQGRIRPATENQVRAIHVIANQQQVDLAELLRLRFVAQAEELSVRDASSLIDELNARVSGQPRPRIAG